MTKTLYFENTGHYYAVNEFSDVGNHRIRTAFVNDEGTPYYIELMNSPRRNERYQTISKWAVHIEHLFPIVNGYSGPEVERDWKAINCYNYNKASITVLINELTNSSFDTIQVLHQFYGYRVHGDHGRYNLINDHKVDHEQAEKRKSTFDTVDQEYRLLLHEKYSQIRLTEMDENSITIECFATAKSLGDIPRIKRIEIA